jgi:hypothetical protein
MKITGLFKKRELTKEENQVMNEPVQPDHCRREIKKSRMESFLAVLPITYTLGTAPGSAVGPPSAGS